MPPTTPAADTKTQDNNAQNNEQKDDLPLPTKLYKWYNSTKGSSAIIDAKTYRVLGIDSKRIAGDIVAKGYGIMAIARHAWDIDLAADDVMNTHTNYRTIAHNIPRCLFEVPSFFLHTNAWNHVQLDSKQATITMWAHKLK